MNGKIRAISALCLIAMTAAGCAQNTPAQTETTQATTETESSEKVLEETEETAQTEETTAEVTEMTETEEQTPDETETNDSAKLELSAISWDTDLYKYTNAVAYKISDGDITVDLNGDGVDEVLNFTHNDDSDEAKGYTDFENTGNLPVIPYLNGEPAQILNVEGEGFNLFDKYSFSMPSGYVYVCDIMEGDGFKELAFVPFSYTDDYNTIFVRYDGEKLCYFGSVYYDTPDAKLESVEDINRIGDMNITWGRPMVIDGSGVVKGATRLAYQTWFGYTEYAVSEEGILDELANVEVYPYGIENRDSYDAVWSKIKQNWDMAESEDDCMLKKDITVYKNPSEDGEGMVITAQPAVPTGEICVSDSRFIPPVDYENWESQYESMWVYVAAKDGTCGWMHAYPYDDVSDLFSVMTMYD